MAPMATKMKPEYAEQLMRQIQEEAEEQGVDLARPENIWTLWTRNGKQLSFRGGSPIPYVVYSLIGHFMLDEAIIFKSYKGKYSIKEFSCSVSSPPPPWNKT